MGDFISLHPDLHERLGPIFTFIDSGVEVRSDEHADPAIVVVRMEPGDRLRRLVAVAVALDYQVQVSWWNPQTLAGWLEQQVAVRRNLGPHTLKAAGCKASGYTAEETARFLGWANGTADLNLRTAEGLSEADWKDLKRAAELWDERVGDADFTADFEPLLGVTA